MKAKNFGLIVAACIFAAGCIRTTAEAVWIPEKAPIHLGNMECTLLDAAAVDNMRNCSMSRAYGTVDFNVAPKRTAVAEESFSLDAGDTVTLDCVYTPKTASVDVGLVAPDGYFYYVNNTDGTFDESIEVSERGTYTLAVRNNSSFRVSITGSVHY